MRVLASAALWALVLLIGGAASLTAGVWLAFGMDGALITGGAFAVIYGAALAKVA